MEVLSKSYSFDEQCVTIIFRIFLIEIVILSSFLSIQTEKERKDSTGLNLLFSELFSRSAIDYKTVDLLIKVSKVHVSNFNA